MSGAKKIMMGGGAVDVPVDDDFNTVAFLSHFDGANNGVNNVFDDGSASNHTITAVSTINQGSFSPFSRPDGEWGALFAGNNSSFLTSPANSLNLGTANFTIEGWVYTTSTAQQLIVGSLKSQNGYGSYFLGINDGYTSKQVRFFCRYNGGTVLDYSAGSGTVPTNSWNHIAVTRDGANVRLFLNGTQLGSTNTTLSSHAIDAPRGGQSTQGTTDVYYVGKSTDGLLPFIGNLSNLRVVVGTAVYTSNFTPSIASLTAITNTKLLTCQSNRFVDNSAEAHAIVAYGPPQVTPFGPILTNAAYDPAVNGGSATGSGTQYLTAASSSDFAIGTSDFCIEMWLFPTTTPDAALEIPFSTRRTAGGNYMFLHYDNNQISIGTSGAFKLNLATTAIKPVQWNHVCWARSSGVSMAFINGVKIGQANDTTDYLQEGVTVFGVGNDQQYTGNMACFRFVNGSNPRGTSTFAIPTTAPTAITNTKLLLNMANAQVFDNAAINTLTLTGHANTSTDQAKFGTTSLHLDGTDDLVALSGHHVFGTGDYTVEMFVYHTSISGQQTYFSDPNGNNAGVYFYKDSNNKLGLYYAGQIVTGSGNVPANQWAHVAVCRASGTSRLFLDGVLQGSASDTTNLTETTYSIGNSVGASNEFIGYIDDIRVSKVARYTANFTPATEPFPDKGR